MQGGGTSKYANLLNPWMSASMTGEVSNLFIMEKVMISVGWRRVSEPRKMENQVLLRKCYRICSAVKCRDRSWKNKSMGVIWIYMIQGSWGRGQS